jgi:parallel beta-helix repeat protein
MMLKLRKTAVAMTLITALLFTATAGAIVIHLVRADPYIEPEQAPVGYRIYGNGTYDVPNLRRDGNLYTLTEDVNGTIVIERDSIVLDGSGHTLQGKGDSIGVWLQDRNAVAIRNLNIRNFGHGIRFSHYAPDWHSGQTNPIYTTNCTIQACNITDNDNGISFYLGVSNCNILDNYVANSINGITFSGSGNTFRNNRIDGNQYDFWDQDDGDNNVDTSNIVNGKPIIYWVNKHNITVPQNAGLVILKKCDGIKVQNLNLAGHGVGLTLYYTNNSKISGNNITNNRWRGISIWWSNNNSITGNHITNNANDGIEEYESHGNIVSQNLIKANLGSGIYHRYLISNDVITNNQIIKNQGAGISGDPINCTITDNFVFENAASGISVDSNCIVARNNITSNGPITSAFQGAGLGFRNNCTIVDNYVSKNNRGIWTYDGKRNIITGNTIAYNNNEGIRFQGPAENNLVYHNNFIENNHGGAQATVNDVLNSPAPNAWDNGISGNYWSDYASAPYFIADKNQDSHPLSNPIKFAPLELPSIPPLAIEDTTPQETDGTNTETPSGFPALFIASVALAIVLVSVGFVVYFKKRKR